MLLYFLFAIPILTQLIFIGNILIVTNSNYKIPYYSENEFTVFGLHNTKV